MANGSNAVPDAITLVDAPFARKFTAAGTILVYIKMRTPSRLRAIGGQSSLSEVRRGGEPKAS